MGGCDRDRNLNGGSQTAMADLSHSDMSTVPADASIPHDASFPLDEALPPDPCFAPDASPDALPDGGCEDMSFHHILQ